MFSFKHSFMSLGVPWAIISLTALILMPWTLSSLVCFFSTKFAPARSFILLHLQSYCAHRQSRTLLFRTVLICSTARLYGITIKQSILFIDDVYHIELSGALGTFLNLLTVALNSNWLDIDHMLRKLPEHSNSL